MRSRPCRSVISWIFIIEDNLTLGIAQIAKCADHIVVAASVYSDERQAFDIQVWTTGSHASK